MRKKKKQSLIFIFSFFIIINAMTAQKNGLYIVDSLSKTPIQYALVQNSNLQFNETSNENGFVNLNKLPILSNTLLISCIGFKTKLISLPNIKLTNQQPPIVYLQQKITSLSEVTINANTGNNIFKIISGFDIHLRPINNSQEVLRMVPGLFIGQHAGGGKAEQIFLRGFDVDHGTDINITVDGMPVNMVSHAHGQGYADVHFVIPELIDKVNFNKGPYFADKGNFTTAGFVEFKTNNYLEKNFIKLEGGQFNSFRAVTALNLLKSKAEKKKQSLYFAGESAYTKGYFDSPQNFTRFNGMLKYHGNINNNNTLSITLSAFTSKWNASGQIPERAVNSGLVGFYGAIDNTEGGKTARRNANVELLSSTKNGASFRNQLYYSKYFFELYSNFTFFKEDPINGDQIKQKENRDILGYNSNYQQEHYIGNLKAEKKTGIQIRYDAINNIELTRTKNRLINTNRISLGNISEVNAGIYYSEKIFLTPKLDATAALRYDYFSNLYNDKLLLQKLTTTSGIFLPKLNFNYTINNRVQLYLYNGKGYHSNDTRVATQKNGKKVLPPAYGSDVGGIFKLGKSLFIQAAAWYLWLDQEFIYVGDEGVVEAGGQTKRFGLDLSARYEIFKHIYADIDISIARARFIKKAKEESYLPLAPTFTSIGGLTYRKQSGWNGNIKYRYMANRPANETNTVMAKGYFVIDGDVSYLTPKIQAGIAIQNLLNTKWKETQFDTESQLKTEPLPISEIHFTPGTPFFAKFYITIFINP